MPQLKISKSTKESHVGIMRSTKIIYMITCSLELSKHEHELLNKHNLDELLLTVIFDETKNKNYEVKVIDLINNFTMETRDAWLALEWEDEIKDACIEFNQYFNKVTNFTSNSSIDLSKEP